MDFNVKKLASGAGLFFTRAVQVRVRVTPPDRPSVPDPLLLRAARFGPKQTETVFLNVICSR